jgi:hypothetical protein
MKKYFLLLFLILITAFGFAHPVPNSLLIFDIKEKTIMAEFQLPLSELELAFGKSLISNPQLSLQNYNTELKNYILGHTHIYGENGQLWKVNIVKMEIGKAEQSYTGVYNQLEVYLVWNIPEKESNRKFTLRYDGIVHQVINHQALVSIRQDWDSGKVNNQAAEIGVISMNTEKNVVYPLKINLSEGSTWKGFKSMVFLGVEHIVEGVDHLLFLLVLLLPSPLLVNGKRWSSFAGIRPSLIKILKIVTGFTIGHSITLFLGASGWIHIPSQIVEILIAVSILITAVHAVRPIFPNKEVYIASLFGLIHGLAFAATLTNLNLSPGKMILSILGFNIGIEIMQLFVVIMIMPWLLILSKNKDYIYLRISGAIFALIASVCWITERVTNTPNLITQKLMLLPNYANYIVLFLISLSIVQLLFKDKKLKN